MNERSADTGAKIRKRGKNEFDKPSSQIQEREINIYKHILFIEFTDYIINHLFNILG